ncbi:MAG: CehA/McbA family metallohydrolase [Candidatus Eisenbacteria bacterium]|nr:CehA/McbA family metallohydrolase [Candidatus Eisenbacteria bacterium]
MRGRFPLIALGAAAIVAGVWIFVALRGASEGPKRPSGFGDGGGSASIEPAAPAACGSPGTWTIRYVAGPEGIGAGGGVVVHFPLFWEWSPPQTASPEMAGYVTAVCASDGAVIDFYADHEQHYVMVQVTEGELVHGDTVTVVYGDTLGGAHPEGRARADSYAERGQEFLVKVDGDGDRFFAEIGESPRIDILPGEAARLLLTLRGEAVRNDSTRVTVAALDRFGNRAVRYEGTVRFSHRWNVLGLPVSYTFTPEDEGAHVFVARFTSPGLIRLRVVEQGGTMEGISNPILVRSFRDESPYTLLWADLHQHSRLSDGTGEPEDLYRYARDVANLDAAAITDHDHHGLRPLGTAEWEWIRRVNEEFHEPGVFVPFLAYEWTNWVWGHRNVYYRGGTGELLSTADPATDTPNELWARLPEGEAMTIAHHTGGGPIAVDWSAAPPERLERLVEISSVHGSSECLGCPGEIYNPVSGSFVRDALGRGYHLGFLGGGDGHIGHPGVNYGESGPGGMAGIYAAGRTREAIWDALQARRVYATTGPRILLDVRLGDHRMGEEIPAETLPERLIFHVSVCGTGELDRAELIRDGAVVDTLYGEANKLDGDMTAEAPGENTAFYYVRVSQMDGALAWSSPIWVVP